jgi:hypothetical protein
MGPRARHSTYKGLAIMTRWFELDRGDSWGPGTRRYAGSYFVAVLGPGFGAWQYLHQDAFDSFHAASAHALSAAKRIIDTNRGQDVGAGGADRIEACRE